MIGETPEWILWVLVGLLIIMRGDDLLAVFFGLVCPPVIPHRECTIIPCPSKILLSNAGTVSIVPENGAPVRGLRSKSRPLVIGLKLAVPALFRNRLLPMSHLAS